MRHRTDMQDRSIEVPPQTGPQRTCVGCGTRAGQDRLVRLALAGGQVLVDRENRGGRGAWLHPGEACLERALKRKVFGRAFRQTTVVADAAILRDQLTRSSREH
jgi:uncharacterized protein